MLDYFDINRFNELFQLNLADWCMGGPREFGYTRAGPVVFLKQDIRLVAYRYQMINIDDVLAKNQAETERWHLSFLQEGKVDTKSAYYVEYLLPRLDEEQSQSRMSDVLDLLHSIQTGMGVHHPVWVADVEGMGLDFRYFRFDGAHRACCAKVCGLTEIPAYVFTAVADS